MNYFKIFFALLAISVLVVPAYATLVSFRGYAFIGNATAPSVVISAFNDSSYSTLLLSRTSDGNGYYIIDLDETGTIYFRVAGINDGNGSVGGGGLIQLNLSVDSLADGSSCSYDIACSSNFCVHDICRASDPYCGDNFCDAGEATSNCAVDCPAPPAPSGGSGGGGGGSGGGGFISTTPSNSTNTSSSSNQTNTTIVNQTITNEAGAGGTGAETTENTSLQNNASSITVNNETSTLPGAGITGFAVDVLKEPTTIVGIVVVALLIVAYVVWRMVYRKKQVEKIIKKPLNAKQKKITRK